MAAECDLGSLRSCRLEDFRQLRRTDTQIRCDFLGYIARISSLHQTEICGLISDNSLFFVKNISPSPVDTFFIDPAKHVEVLDSKKINYCFHSHPFTSAVPSQSDIDLSDNALIPFLIFSVLEKQFALYDPDTQQTVYFLI